MDNLIKVNEQSRVDGNYPPPETAYGFNKKLADRFGMIGGKQRYRVVWGQANESKIWQTGKQRLRYIWAIRREERLYGAIILDAKTGNRKVIGFDKANSYIAKSGEIILPQIDVIEEEIGDPFYWLEYYAPASYFGTKEEWDSHRWADLNGDGNKIDLNGNHPSKGRYEPLLRLSILTNEGEDYLPLSDSTFDWVASMLQGDEQKMKQALQEQTTRLDREVAAAFADPDIDREAENTKKHRFSLIMP